MNQPNANRIAESCPDCAEIQELNRRDFVKRAGGAALVAGVVPWIGLGRSAQAAPTPKSAAETVVTHFYKSLSEAQRSEICFPFGHDLRSKINANWSITKPSIGDAFYSNDQRKLIDDILRGVTSEDGYKRFLEQMDDDAGGFNEYHVAIFGEPGTAQFQWEMTGRHLTIRADGDSVSNAAFGGPIVYGHGESNPKKNLFHYQTQKANEVFAALDPRQREAALLEQPPQESQVPIQGVSGTFPGISVGALSSDQKALVESVVKVILAPYRQDDVDEALAILKSSGGFDKLHLAFYKKDDLADDQVWDVWRVEGPGFVWHFRGAPHVHTYVNIGVKA